MILPYPVDSPGYITFPGTPNNNATISRTTLSTAPGSIQFTFRVRLDALSSAANLGGWSSLHCYLQINADRTLYIQALNAAGTQFIGAVNSTSAIPASPGVVGQDVWVRGKVTIATAVCNYWYTYEEKPTTWVSLGSPTGSNAGAALNLGASAPLQLGAAAAPWWSGRMYYFSEELNGVETVRFDATADLAGVPANAATFVPSIPTTSLVTVNSKTAAAGQGYVSFPGTIGNYLQVADVAALDITGALTVVWRERARDLTPTKLGQAIVSKAATAGQYAYNITHGPRDFILSRSADGTAVTRTHVGSAEVPFALSATHNERWIWFCLTFDTVPAQAVTRLWYSEDDTFTPPAAARWLPVATGAVNAVADAAAKTIFSGSSLMLIGAGDATTPSFNGDIGYLSLRNGGSNAVLGGSEVWRMDADSLLRGVDGLPIPPDAPTIVPAVGGNATVMHTPTPKSGGYIDYPGTPGNFVSMSPTVGNLFTDTISFYVKMARDNWLPADPEAIISKWGDLGQRSFLWQLESTGQLTFYWVTTGGVMYGVSTVDPIHGEPVPVPDPGPGVPIFVGMSTTRSGTDRTIKFWTSPDAVTWTQLGGTTVYPQSAAHALFASNVPLIIGSTARMRRSCTDLNAFDGRILEVAGSTGADGFFGGYTDVVETFRIGPEHLTSSTATSIPVVGGTATVIKTAYPVDFGVWRFPGTRGNYLQVPDAANLRVIDNFCAEVRIAPNDWTPQDTDRLLIGKMGASGQYGWQFLLTPTGTLKMLHSTNGTVLNSVESTVPVPLQDYFSKRVAVTYVSTDRVRFWTSDDGITWDKLGVDTFGSGVLFASNAPVQIGVTYPGAMTDASIRDGVALDGRPVLDTEVFLMDQGCLNIDPHPATFVAVTGQTVTVFTDDVSLNDATQGWVDLPGTTGNYLDTPDHFTLDLNGSMTFILRIAPNDWTRTGKTQTLLAKWSATAGNYSYLLQLLPSGIFRFTWTTDGSTPTYIDSGQMASYVDGEFRMIAFTFEWTTTVKTLRRWESLDFGNSWTLRSTATTSFGGASPIWQGNAPLTIGANNNTENFEGRISYLDIRNGVAADGGLGPASARALWWSAESLHINTLPALPAVATFVEETGKTITIRRSTTPTIPGDIVFYGHEGDYASVTVPTLVSTTGMTLVTRIDLSETRPATDRLAAGAASTTQVPRPNIVGNVFITAYLAIVAGTADQTLCGAWWPQNETSWRLYIDGFTGGLRFAWTTDGINPEWESPLDIATKAQLTALGSGMLFVGLQIERNVSGASRFTAMHSTDQGATWIPFGTVRSGPLMEDTWPADPLMDDTKWRVRLTVGGAQLRDLTKATDAQAVTDASWRGQIRWVQMTQYPSDTLIWRFDSNDWPGTEITYTDPRAYDWRLDSMTAIGQVDPPEAPDEQIVVQRWDETVDCSFSLRRVTGGFVFSLSLDGTPDVGGDIDIPVDMEEWHPSELPGNWGWLAITQRISTDGKDSLVRLWRAPDTGSGTVPTSWTEIDTEVTAPGISALFVDATEVVTIGGGADGKLPFIGKISHLSLRDGTGTNGVVGGTERFRIDMTSLYGVLSSANSFTAGTGQTVSLLPNTAARLADIDPTPDGQTCIVDGPDILYDGSPPGPTLYLDPAPPGPLLSTFPSTAGPVTVITPSPAAPTTTLVSPSLDRGWWPGQVPPYLEDPTKWWTQPAFTVQRQLPAATGDYVRGSANATTQQTAVRFSTTSMMEGLSPEGLGKGIIFATPHPDAPYDTVKIEWNIPSDLSAKGMAPLDATTPGPSNTLLDPWLQVAIVRSAFGAPTTVNDGQTIFLATKSSLYPPLTNSLGVVTHPYKLDDDDNILTEDVLDPRDPKSSGDPKLPNGRWYYYSLFFMVGKTWWRAASDQVLLPRNHHHAEHLWDGLPPYYRWADEQEARGEPGHLQRFLAVFGYDFDLTREMIESWQNMYQTDFTPVALLRRIGETFGLPYESTIGDIRYRSLVAKIGFLYIGRGTSGTLRRYVSAASKCDCDIVTSPNIMLLPDDSDFYGGTGNWAGLHSGTTIGGSGIPAAGARLTPDKIRLDYGLRNRPAVPEGMGRGSMHLWSSKADATTSFIITCGDGERYNYDTGAAGDTDRTNDILLSSQPDSLIPRFHGIHVKPNDVVAFSFNANADLEAQNTVVQALLIFFSKVGQPASYISHDLSGLPISLTLATDTATGLAKWYQVVDDAPVPAGALYCVPAIVVTGRVAGTHATLSPMIHIAGAQFIVQGNTTTVSGTDPAQQMLTLNYTGETIGGVEAGFIDSKLGDER